MTALGSVPSRRKALQEREHPWVPRTVHGLLDHATELWGDRPYVLTDDVSWTYTDVAERSRAIATGLHARGVRVGEHVALLMSNQPEFVAVKYALSRLGVVCVPVNFLNRRDELGYVLRQSRSVALVTMDSWRGLDYLAMLDELCPGWEQDGGGSALPDLREVVVLPLSGEPLRAGALGLAELARLDSELPADTVDVGDTCDILYTSGTTGSPKGVLLTHDMIVRTAYGAAFSRAFQDGRRVLFSLPMYHVYGYLEGLLAVPWVGGAIVPQAVFDPVAMLDAVERHRAQDVLLVPVMTLALLDAVRAGHRPDLSSLVSVISSGGYAPPTLWEDLRALLGDLEATTGYGMTEVTATTTLTEPGGPEHLLRGSNGRARSAGAAGDPALGGALVTYRVIDPETGAGRGVDEVGELLARGPGVTAGYYDKPEETAAAFDPDGWFRTGDLGRLDADGFLHLAGRSKEVYRCNGEQVMPLEVENVLLAHPDVSQAFVVPLPHPRMGEVGVAYVVLGPDVALDPTSLRAHCADRLARFKVPAHVVAVAAQDVPATASGRPRKFLLAERAVRELGAS